MTKVQPTSKLPRKQEYNEQAIEERRKELAGLERRSLERFAGKRRVWSDGVPSEDIIDEILVKEFASKGEDVEIPPAMPNLSTENEKPSIAIGKKVRSIRGEKVGVVKRSIIDHKGKEQFFVEFEGEEQLCSFFKHQIVVVK